MPCDLDTKLKVNRKQETSDYSYFTLAVLPFNMHVLVQKNGITN